MSKKIHLVIDSHTGDIVRRFANLVPAHRYADKLDLAYGAIRYCVGFDRS